MLNGSIRVLGNANREYKKAAEFFLSYLLRGKEHKNFEVEIFNDNKFVFCPIMRSELNRIGDNYNGFCGTDTKRNVFQVGLNEKNIRYYGKSPIEILAHEIVHVYQRVIGKYKYDILKNLSFWENEIIDIKNIPYRELPWEVEAYNLQEFLFNLYLESFKTYNPK